MTEIENIIENISKNFLKDFILGQLDQSNKDMVEDNFEFFIEYLKEDDLCAICTQYICTASYENAKSFLIKMINCFNIKNINADETLKLIIDNGTHIKTRFSDWNLSEIPLVNDSLLDINAKCLYAQFKDINKWGYKSYPFVRKIMYNDNKVFWINDHYEKEPQYFILKNEKIYGISYMHNYRKYITIYNNLDITFKEFIINSNETNFDDIIKKYDQTKFKINKTEIDLSEYLYKGPSRDRKWMQGTSELKSIEFNNGLLKIEIENFTYHYIGYVL